MAMESPQAEQLLVDQRVSVLRRSELSSAPF